MLGTVKLLADSACHFLLICDDINIHLFFFGGGGSVFFFCKVQPINDLNLDFVFLALSRGFEAKNETHYFLPYTNHMKNKFH